MGDAKRRGSFDERQERALARAQGLAYGRAFRAAEIEYGLTAAERDRRAQRRANYLSMVAMAAAVSGGAIR